MRREVSVFHHLLVSRHKPFRGVLAANNRGAAHINNVAYGHDFDIELLHCLKFIQSLVEEYCAGLVDELRYKVAGGDKFFVSCSHVRDVFVA